VLGQFKDREAKREQMKPDMLAPFINEAQLHIQPLENMQDVPPVEAYPLMWNQMSTEKPQGAPDRRPGMSAFWQVQVGKRSKK